jgi:hypothetical protein
LNTDMHLSFIMFASQELLRNLCRLIEIQSESQRLYFARDPLGRRSLLIHRPSIESPYFLLSSVSAGANPAYDFSEVSAQCIFLLDFRLLKVYGGVIPLSDSVRVYFGSNGRICRSYLGLRKRSSRYPGLHQ